MFTKREIQTVTSRRIGTFKFDVVVSEAHNSTLNITENPIETGESIADHAFLAPDGIIVSGVMVSYEPHQGFDSILPENLSFVGELPLPVNVDAITAQARAMASQVISVTQEIKPRVIAPFLPNFNRGGQDNSSTLNRVMRAYQDLKAIQKSAELVEVVTGSAIYKNMALQNISLVQTDDGSAQFTLALREVFIVNTQTAGGLTVQPAPGRTSNQSATTVNNGNTQPQSLLHWKFGVLL